MNWKFLLSTSLAFAIIFVILMTIALYIKFKLDSRQKKVKQDIAPNEGRYFKKFLLDDVTHEASENISDKRALKKQQWMNKAIFYFPFAILAGLSLYLWFFHQNLFHDRVRLTSQEVSELKVENRKWEAESSPFRPQMSKLLKELRKKRFRLLISKNGLNFKIPGVGRRTSTEALASWEIWLEKNELQYDICSEEKLTQCLRGRNRIYIVLPDFWKTEDLNVFHSRTFRFILTGAPHQVYQDSESWSWKSLNFKKDSQPEKGLVALPADRELTLGWDPGALLGINRFFGGVKVHSTETQGFRLFESLKFTDAPEPAMVASKTSSGSRFVWIDFLPTSKERQRPQLTNDLMASVFRYLLGQEYSAVGAWPDGKTRPIGLGINIDEFNSHLKNLDTQSLPAAFFSFSTFLEDHRSDISDLQGKGQVHCLSDVNRDFDRESLSDQAQAMALCLKTLGKMFENSASLGLQPPNEKYNEETYSSAAHFGLDFLWVHHLDQFSPKSLRDLKSSFSINLIPRMFSDDHFFFEKNRFSSADLERLIHQEMTMAQKLGVPYIYRTQSSRLKHDDNRKIINIVKQSASEPHSWPVSLSDLSQWWRVRSNLNAGIRLSEIDHEKFQPVVVKVTKSGDLEISKLEAGQRWQPQGE